MPIHALPFLSVLDGAVGCLLQLVESVALAGLDAGLAAFFGFGRFAALGFARGFALLALLLMEFGYLICDVMLSVCVQVGIAGV